LAYYEDKSIPRFAVLSGARRVGKTTIMYQIMDHLIDEGIHPRNILYVSFDNPIVNWLRKNWMISGLQNTKHRCRFCMYTLNGKAMNLIKIQFTADSDIYEILDGLKKNALKLINQYGKKHFVGISLGLPGPYIRKDMDDNNEVNLVSEFEQLTMINLHRELESALGLSVMSEHDAKLSAYAEWKNLKELHGNKHTSLVTLTSIGIGAGTDSSFRYMLERLYEFPDSVLDENSTYHDILNAYREK
jgi:glucokinase